VFEETFGGVVAEPETPLRLAPGAEVERYLGANAARIDSPGSLPDAVALSAAVAASRGPVGRAAAGGPGARAPRRAPSRPRTPWAMSRSRSAWRTASRLGARGSPSVSPRAPSSPRPQSSTRRTPQPVRLTARLSGSRATRSESTAGGCDGVRSAEKRGRRRRRASLRNGVTQARCRPEFGLAWVRLRSCKSRAISWDRSRPGQTRLHEIKAATGRGPADDVVFDLTGNVYDPGTGELLGSLTAGGAKRRY
jgi:hypothetical protein